MTKSIIIVGQLEAGIGRHVKNYCQYVNSNVIVITDVTKSDKLFIDELLHYDVEIIDLSISKQPGLGDLLNIIKIYFKLKNQKPNTVIGHGAIGGLYARLLGLLISNTRTFYVPHGGVLHFNNKSLKGKLYLLVERILVKFTHRILFDSPYSKEKFFTKIKHLADDEYADLTQCIEIENISKKNLEQDNDSDVLTICCAAQLREMIGIDLLIEALAGVDFGPFGFRCDIYGDGTEEDISRYNKLIKQHGLTDDVYLCGVANVLKLYAKYDIYVQPSRFESFGLAAVEAYYAGCDVIVSNTGGLKNNFKSLQDVMFFDTGNYLSLRQRLKEHRKFKKTIDREPFVEKYSPIMFRESYLSALNDK
jgi:glycosyltransferase involved in cell wall biosynthesis